MTVHFEKNLVNLTDSEIVTIESTLKEWMDRKYPGIFINSYTDNTSTPIINI